MANTKVTIPVFTPRQYQIPFFRAMAGVKRAFLVWHRRAGKDKCSLAWLIAEAARKVGVYYFFYPTYTQAKKAIWNNIDSDGKPYLAMIPEGAIGTKNETEMKIQLINGSVIQLVGADTYDSVRSTNPVGCVFAEYAWQDPGVWDTMRPILRENGGWAIFNTTPYGQNHAYDLWEMAKNDPGWFCQKLTVEDTGVLGKSDIDEERRLGMSEEMVQQEFYCSFNGSMVGSFYGRLIGEAEQEGRIGRVAHDPGARVETWWDLGMADATAVLFTQTIGREIRVIDYLEESGEGLPFYAKELERKGYAYVRHNGPHDLEVREMGSGKSRIEVARELGMRFRVVPNIPVMDGIEAVRRLIPQLWIDSEKCARWVKAMKAYRKEWDERRKCFHQTPYHDWSSHGADAARYLAVGHGFGRARDLEKMKEPFREERRFASRQLQEGWMA